MSIHPSFSDAPEQAYRRHSTRRHRKALGQIFTPYPVARFMAAWVLGNPQAKTILDPAVGLGIFFRALLAERPTLSLHGYDIDPDLLAETRYHFQSHHPYARVHLHHDDYLTCNNEISYDGIICNPPYRHFQAFSNRRQALAEFQQQFNLTLNGQTNLYILFLLKSLAQLGKNGRAAYIVPSEFMNADYGEVVKHHLLRRQGLRYVIVFDSTANVFQDAITTSAILLFTNNTPVQAVRFISTPNVAALPAPNDETLRQAGQAVPLAQMTAKTKWRRYYQVKTAPHYKNMAPFSKYAHIKRGIATGANKYFVLNRSRQLALGLSAAWLRPCVSRATQAQGPFFTPAMFQALVDQDKPVQLLDAVAGINDPAVQAYLAHGEAQGIHQRYLTSHRRPWYALEKRPPAPIWAAVFNRQGLRFIRNEAGVYSLTTFHAVYLTEAGEALRDIIFAYLLTRLARDTFEQNQREYGAGLNKFEPNDLNHSQVPDFERLPKGTQQKIETYYRQYRQSYLAGTQNSDTAPAAIEALFKAYIR